MKVSSAIKKATRFHGHLGPFLVLGVKMAEAAMETLGSRIGEYDSGLHATLMVPAKTPYSCVIDGVQATLHCTVGNGKLRVLESSGEISGQFRFAVGEKVLVLRVKPEVVDRLMRQIMLGDSVEKLALEVGEARWTSLFEVETL